jgi:hypothetical protein
MHIPPSGSRPIGQTESTASKSGAAVAKKEFGNLVAAAKPTASAAKATAADIIADVKALAYEVKAGTITKEEASKRFVSIVIEKRHDLSSLGPKAKQIEEALKDIVGDDPVFVSRLSVQLQQLAKA